MVPLKMAAVHLCFADTWRSISLIVDRAQCINE
jgi:hypothetical protein